MANVHLHIPSFNAGELSPLLGARFAVEKVQAGCRRLRNFIIHTHGPAFRRPGMEYMGANGGAAAKSTLRGFNFSTTTGAILEFHPDGLRVWSNGVLVDLVNAVPLPYSEAECAEVQMVQVNDICYLAHPNHEPLQLVRYADDDWRLEDIEWKWPALGDENVRSDETATAEKTELHSVPTYEWPEFTIPAEDYTFRIDSPDTSATAKAARLFRWSGTAWVLIHAFSWTTVAPSDFDATFASPTVVRMTYDGPITTRTQVETATAAGSITGDGNAEVIVTAAGVTGSPITVPVAVLNGDSAATWAGKVRAALALDADITAVYTVGGASTAITLTRIAAAMNDATLNISLDNDTCTGITPAPTSVDTTAGSAAAIVEWPTGAVTDAVALDLGIFQPENLEPVSVAAGEWQVEVTTPAAVPAGAKLYVQRVVGATRTNLKILTPIEGETVIWRGPRLGGTASILLNWLGRESGGGDAKAFQLDFPASNELTLKVSATSGESRTMTAEKAGSPVAIFLPGHVGSYWQITHRRDAAYSEIVAAVPTISAANGTAIRVAGKWEVFSYGTWDATLYLEKKIGATWEVVRTWTSNSDRNIVATGEEDEEVEMRLRISAGTSASASGAAVPRFILEATDSRVNGLVYVTAVGSLDDNGKASTATVDVLTDLHATTATPIWTEGAWSDARGFPRAVALQGGRLWFGGTQADAQKLWGSVVNDYQNFRRSSIDDASVAFTPAAQQSNRVQWLAAHGEDLVIGTTGDEWTLGASEEKGIVTPTNVKMLRRSGYGSAYLPALLLGGVVVFVQRGGRKLRQISPRSDVTEWSAADLTVLAEHVTKTGVVQVATMSFPQSILWAVTADGKLLGMTFEQEQNVFGWHVHETDGLVESVAVVYGADSDEVWLSVKRGEARNIERLDPLVFARAFDEPERLMYVDAGARIELEDPAASVTGLDHLEGLQVSVLADGADQGLRQVAGGAIALDPAASTVVVGLPFTSELQPMRMDIPLRDGTAQHRNWRMSRVGLYVHETLGGEIADGPEGRFEKLGYRRVSTPMDGPPPLFTGEVETAIESSAREGADVMVRQTKPLPFNVGSITLKGDVYGE